MPATATGVARCASCSADVPGGAKFCPRCGKPAPVAPARNAPPAPTDLGKLPSPIPLAGILFLTGLVLGPAAIVAGIMLKSSVLLVGGIAVAVLVILVLLLGLAF